MVCLVGPHATSAERNEFAEKIKENPANYIAQPTLALSRSPCLTESGAAPRHVDLRTFILQGKNTTIATRCVLPSRAEGRITGCELQSGRRWQRSLGFNGLTKMLSRSAQGLYWMNRYLERADHSCRLLTYQFEEIEDRPVAEIDQSWRRIYSALNCTPTAGFLQSDLDDDDFMLTDSFTLADDLTFDRSNLNSIVNCVENARENARQVRNVIGKQIWSEMNAAYLSLKEVRIEHIWNTQPRQFYLDFGSDIRTLFGVMDSSMYRDHGWQFSQLGRFVERVQLVASLIRSQYEVSSKSDTNSVVDWYSTLQVCEAALAYTEGCSQ